MIIHKLFIIKNYDLENLADIFELRQNWYSPKLARPMIATVNDANDENTTIALPENVVPSGYT